MSFTAQDFVEVQDESAKSSLIKFAAFKQLSQLTTNSDKIPMSIKYQVLCDATAMVGVLKNPAEKSSFFTKEVVVCFSKKERDMEQWRED